MNKKMLCAGLVLFFVFCQIGNCATDFKIGKLTHGVIVKISHDVAPDMDCKWIVGTEAYRSMSDAQKDFIQRFMKHEYHKSFSITNFFTSRNSVCPVYYVRNTPREKYRRICLRAVTEEDAGKMAEALVEYVMPEIKEKQANLEKRIQKQGMVVKDYDAKIKECSAVPESVAKELAEYLKKSGYEHRNNSAEIRKGLEERLDGIAIKRAGIEAKKMQIMRVLDMLNQKISKVAAGSEDYRKGLITMKLKYEEQQIDLDIELSGIDGEVNWSMKKLTQIKQYDEIVRRAHEAELNRSKNIQMRFSERKKLDNITDELVVLTKDNKQIIDQDMPVTYLK